MAEEQARDVTRRAARDADQLTEETQADAGPSPGDGNAELDELRQSQLARAGDPAPPGRAGRRRGGAAHPDRDRAAAGRRPAGRRGRARPSPRRPPGRWSQTATLEAEALRAAAEKDAGRISQQAAEKRSRTPVRAGEGPEGGSADRGGPAGQGHRAAARGQRAPDRGDRARRPAAAGLARRGGARQARGDRGGRADRQAGPAAGGHHRRAGAPGVRLAAAADAPRAGPARPAQAGHAQPAHLAQRAGRRDRGEAARGSGPGPAATCPTSRATMPVEEPTRDRAGRDRAPAASRRASWRTHRPS